MKPRCSPKIPLLCHAAIQQQCRDGPCVPPRSHNLHLGWCHSPYFFVSARDSGGCCAWLNLEHDPGSGVSLSRALQRHCSCSSPQLPAQSRRSTDSLRGRESAPPLPTRRSSSVRPALFQPKPVPLLVFGILITIPIILIGIPIIQPLLDPGRARVRRRGRRFSRALP